MKIPLYYTGLTDKAKVQEQNDLAKDYKLDRQFEIELPVSIPAKGYSWFVIE